MDENANSLFAYVIPGYIMFEYPGARIIHDRKCMIKCIAYSAINKIVSVPAPHFPNMRRRLSGLKVAQRESSLFCVSVS